MKISLSPRRLTFAAIATIALGLLGSAADASAKGSGTSPASATTSTLQHAATTQVKGVSANWSGYAVTRSTVSNKFSRVAGTWTQPKGQCTAGEVTYSAVWVGLGGFKEGSKALEQTGTEVDCSASGEAIYSAWYELVPASPVPLDLVIHPGDEVSASVAITNGKIVMQVKDLTTGRAKTVVRTMSDPSPDKTSAEWIVEAPSACSSTYVCRTLPLTDFGTVTFTKASVTTAQGSQTSIAGSGYSITELELRDVAHTQERNKRGPALSLAGATPTALNSTSNGFVVTWQRLEGEGESSSAPTLPSGEPSYGSERR